MRAIRNVCVYCGSAAGAEPVFVEAASALGQALAAAGVKLVYGGGNSGLMGALARSVLAHGGHVTGVMPDFLKSRELMLKEAQELVIVADMHARKRLMFERADAFKDSAGHRLEIWHFAGQRIAERPLLGWGLDASRAIPGGNALIRRNSIA